METDQSLCFLGYEYHFPADLIQYISILDTFEEYRQRLLSEFTHLISIGDEPDIDVIPAQMQEACRSVANDVVTMLCEHGIYEFSIDTLVSNNEGYRRIKDDADRSIKQIFKILQEEAIRFYQNYQGARNAALSQVTGTGVRVYTNSFTSLALYSAYENSVLQQQISKADADFKKTMDGLCSNSTNTVDKRIMEEKVAVWCPAARDAIALFTYLLMDSYISGLSKAGQFDISTVNIIEADKSNAVLANLSAAKDKKAALYKAFTFCPNNRNVYLQAAKMGLMSKDVVAASEMFNTYDVIIDFYKATVSEKTGEYPTLQEKLRFVLSQLPILEEVLRKTRQEIVIDYLGSYAKQSIAKLATLKRTTLNDAEFDKWCHEHIGNTTTSIIEMPLESVNALIDQFLESIFPASEYDAILQIDAASLSRAINHDLSTDNTPSLEEIYRYWHKQIIAAFQSYSDNAKRRKDILSKALQERDAFVLAKKRERRILKNQIESSGALAIIKKRRLRDAVEAISQEINTANEKYEIAKLEKQFEQMYRK